jgi:calcineurin-like phosphoesterase family protein
LRFFTSDTHFGHKNIIKYSNRPFKDVDDMNWQIVNNWNKTVSPDDVVYHLGDVALGPWTEWDNILTRLNGYKILVVGNHDRIFKGEKKGMQDRFATLYAKWFDEVHDNHSVSIEGTQVNLSHFPYDGDSHDGDRFTQFRLEDDGTILVHGHTHAEWAAKGVDSRVSWSKKGTLQIHVGMDSWHYTPVPEERVVELIKEYS